MKAKPKMDAGPDVAICPKDAPGAFLQGGLAANNAAPEPIRYQWFPATGLNNDTTINPFARPDTTTIYTLIGISANGCSSEASTLDTLSTVEVVVKPRPQAFAGADTGLCVLDSIRLQGYAGAAGPQYEYYWSPVVGLDDPNSPTPMVSPPVTTTYTLTVVSNGCESNGDQIRVQVDTRPTVSAASDAVICYRDTVMLEGRADGDPDATLYRYQWSPTLGLSDPTIGNPGASPAQTTNYIVVATTEYGCVSEPDTVEITVEPTPEVSLLNPDTVICAGDEIVLTAAHSFTTPAGGPVVYQWFPQGVVTSDPFDSVVTVRPMETTLIEVQTSIGAGDCPTRDAVLVSVSPAVTAGIAADTNRICAGAPLVLTALGSRGNASFSWSPVAGLNNRNSEVVIAKPDTTTTYQVIVSEGVCADTASFELLVNPTPEGGYLASLAEGCAPLAVQFLQNAPGATAYSWDFGDGSPLSNQPDPMHTYEAPGTYTVTLRAAGTGGCEAIFRSTEVVVAEGGTAGYSSVPAPGSRLPLPGAEVVFSQEAEGAVSWFWDFGDGTTASEANPVHSYSQPGRYVVTLTTTDASGCVSQVQYQAYEVFVPGVYVPNVFSPNGDGSNDVFLVEYEGTERFELEIFDRWGRQVHYSERPAEGWDGTREGSLVNEGVYYYSLRIGEQGYTGSVTLLR
ncbi:MAG: PKD domain-containing protein [Planctomycetota bacterium]|nr:MAG: PKD domain-containing protein [Planctomycetota bacterium]